MSLGIKSSAFLRVDPSFAHRESRNPNVHGKCSRQLFTANVHGICSSAFLDGGPTVNPEIQLPIIFRGKGETCAPPLGQGFRTAWLIKGQKFPWRNLQRGAFILFFWDASSHICQKTWKWLDEEIGYLWKVQNPEKRKRKLRNKIRFVGLKWVHMARYKLVLRQDGAIWLRIISKPLLTKKWFIQIQKCHQHLKTGVALG